VVAELADIPTARSAGHRRAAGFRCRHRPRRMTSPLAVAAGSCRRPAPAARTAGPGEPAPGLARPGPAPAPDVLSAARSAGIRSGDRRTRANRRATLRRRRAVAAGLLAVVILTSGIGIRAALGRTGGGPLAATGAPGGPRAASGQVWIVRPGDTLWSIAEAVDRNGDVRPLVDRLAGEAGGTTIYPGESIAISGR
jgi:nucleoid-associated protein YgaU